MSVKRLYIVRHGQTDQNRNRIVQGRGIDSILNETGQSQAVAFFQHYQHTPFDYLFCSSQQRSYQTINQFEQQGFKILKDARLDEIGWGEHEGKGSHPELMDKYYRIIQSWSNGNYHDAAQDGESAFELSIRLQSFLDEIHLLNFTNALICTHGRTMRAMICLLKKQELLNMELVQHHNTGLYLLEWHATSWQVILENDCKHLTKSVQL